jgi:hypothetical protein
MSAITTIGPFANPTSAMGVFLEDLDCVGENGCGEGLFPE